jgi:hypothetical protein
MSLAGCDPVAGSFFSLRGPLLPSWRRPWTACCLIACLAAGGGGRADEVGLADGTVVRGTILRIRPDAILFLNTDGTLRAAAVDQDQRFKLDLDAGPRCVHVVDRDGRRRLVSATACAERRLSGTDMEGRPVVFGLDEISEAIVYPVSRPRHVELSFPAFVHHRKNASGRLCQVEFALFRTWKTAAGAEFPATLVDVGERTIRVQPTTGDAIELPIDGLDRDSAGFVARLQTGRRQPQPGGPTAAVYAQTLSQRAGERGPWRHGRGDGTPGAGRGGGLHPGRDAAGGPGIRPAPRERSVQATARRTGADRGRVPHPGDDAADGRTFPLRAFLENSERCFAERTGVAYAMARYLCFFLQEKQLLFPWYARYCRNFADDRQGIRSLEEAYGKPLDQIEADWVAFVKALP